MVVEVSAHNGANMGLRWTMLASAALVALTGYHPAQADTTITGVATRQQNWTSGNFTVTSTGTINASTAISSTVPSLGTLTIDGLGKLIASNANNADLDNTGTIAAVINNGTISGTIASNDDYFGIKNSGSIGTVTNNGTIIGDRFYFAIDNSGSIGAILNEGTINGIAGITNDSGGTIDKITNSGTINASASGIVSNGTIGTLVNNGTILAHGSGVGVLNGSRMGTLVNTGTIQGGNLTGIWNLGSIGVLSNSGLITDVKWGILNSSNATVSTLDNLSGGIIYGGQTGIKNSGIIGTITNSGSISGGQIGVLNSGTIGTITNSGSISGGNYAIYNTASQGLIVNSGTISGNIYSSNTLTIAGGDSSHYGTLSGGTITMGSGGQGTLALSSDYLWLQDKVVGNVVNTAATLKVSTAVSISGNYTQSGGGLVIVTSGNGSSYGALTVGGAASITNTHITISGTGLTSGQTFTIVQASSGSYSNDVATVNGTLRLGAKVSTRGNDLVVTLALPDTYQSVGQSVGSSGVGAALDILANATTTSADMQSILSIIDGLSSTSAQAQAQAIKELGPAQSVSSPQMSFNTGRLVAGAVAQHQQSAMAYDAATGKAAGSEANQNTLWGQVLGGGAIQGTTTDADGSRMREFGLATGVDHMLTDNLMGGVALSWVRAYASGSDTSATNSTLDNYMLTGYGSYRVGRLAFEGQAGFGYGQYHQDRAIAFLNRTATADYDSKQYLLRGRVGYDISVDQNMTVTPLAGLTWLRSVNDGYTETGAGAANLTVDRRGSNSLSHDLGAKVSWSLDTGWGRVKPEARAEWVHDYQKGAYTTSGSLDGAAFTAATSRINPNGAQIGLAATLDGTDSLSFRAEYDGELRPNYQSHTGMLKAIWEF